MSLLCCCFRRRAGGHGHTRREIAELHGTGSAMDLPCMQHGELVGPLRELCVATWKLPLPTHAVQLPPFLALLCLHGGCQNLLLHGHVKHIKTWQRLPCHVAEVPRHLVEQDNAVSSDYAVGLVKPDILGLCSVIADALPRWAPLLAEKSGSCVYYQKSFLEALAVRMHDLIDRELRLVHVGTRG